MPSQKISQFPAQTTVASGDILALVTVSGSTFDNKRIGIDVLDGRYHASASGGAALEIAVEALASGNAALTDSLEALASGNAGISLAIASGNAAQASGNAGISLAIASGNVAQASGNAALVDASAALASGNAALTDVSGKYDKTGGPITGTVTVKDQSIGEIGNQGVRNGTITLDFASANNFEFVLDGTSTLGVPTNASGGQCGAITIRQDSTGSRTLAYNAVFNFAGGTAPTLTTTASGVDVISFYVSSPTEIQSVAVLDLQ
jgi:hypothetical protein